MEYYPLRVNPSKPAPPRIDERAMNRLPNLTSHVGLALAVLAAGCGEEAAPSPEGRSGVVVTNTYLKGLVRDVLGGSAEVVSLTGGGTCPGHFDVAPRHVDRLRRCRVLLRLDFQARLEERLRPLAPDLEVLAVAPTGGLCLPQTYRAALTETGEALLRCGLADADAVARTVQTLEPKLSELSTRLARRSAEGGLAGRTVVVSAHQADFCRFLGLEVAGTFSSSDATGVGEIGSLLAATVEAGRPVDLVVANRPEGAKLAEKLAERLGAPVVVLANFPDEGTGYAEWAAMVRGNLAALESAIAQ